MKIIINNELSKVKDFIYYPYVGRFADYILSHETFDDVDYELEGYEEFLKDIKKKMKNYSEIIDKFYSKESNPIIDFIGKDVLLESSDIEGYLNKALELDVETINENMLKFLLDVLDKQEMIENDVSEEKFKDKEYMLSLVKSTILSAGMKWALLCAIDDPQGYIKDYVEFMRNIKPSFDEVWIQGEKELNEYRESFTKEIEKSGMDFINNISGNLFDEENWNFTTAIISLSYISSTSIRVSEFDDILLFHWGYKIEEVFENLKKRKEFELEKRVSIMKTLGDKTKYKMLKLMVENPEICANDIANELELTGATVSYHINLMASYNILKISKVSKKNSFKIDKDTLKDLLQGIIQDFELQYVVKTD